MAKSSEKDKQVKPEFIHLVLDEANYKTLPIKKYTLRKKYVRNDPSFVRAMIPGIIGKIYVSEGDDVIEGNKLLELEAMKMFNQILSPIKGKIKKVNVSSGEKVVKDQILIEIDPVLTEENEHF